MDTATLSLLLAILAAIGTVGKIALDAVVKLRHKKEAKERDQDANTKQQEHDAQQRGMLLVRENQITQQVSETIWRRVNDELKRKSYEVDKLTERLGAAEDQLQIANELLREYIRGTSLLIGAMEKAQKEGVPIDIPWRPSPTNGKSLHV